MLVYEFWSPCRTNRCTHIQCKHTNCLTSGDWGMLTPHTLPFLLHGPNAFERPSNGVITRVLREIKSTSWALTQQPSRPGPAERPWQRHAPHLDTWARPTPEDGSHGGTPGAGVQKAVQGQTEVLGLASQLELKGALCLLCPSIRPSSPGAAELGPTANTGGQCSCETEAVFKSLRDESVLLI